MITQNPILVVGGTGKTGQRVAERLVQRELPVRIGSRSSQTPFDWENQATWTPTLRGVDSVYLTYYPDLAVPGAPDAIHRFTKLAVDHGVRHIVLFSGRGEEEAQQCEQIVQSAGIDWTILQSSWMFQNFSESYLYAPILSGEVVLPAGDIREPFIDADDIADVAVTALLDERHRCQVYSLTGPRLLTFAEAVSEIAHATKRDIRYVQVSPEEYSSMLSTQGVPTDYIWLVNYLFTTLFDGRNAHVTHDVQHILGREAKDFSEYAQATAETGVWNG